jgi:hypothetical protein
VVEWQVNQCIEDHLCPHYQGTEYFIEFSHHESIVIPDFQVYDETTVPMHMSTGKFHKVYPSRI